MKIIRDGPKRYSAWPGDMKHVRDSGFGHSPLPLRQRLSRRRRFDAESGRYPHMLTRRDCWVVRAEEDGNLVGYAWGYLVSPEDQVMYIDDVAVCVEWQEQGIGRALIDELVKWLAEFGVTNITGFPIDPRMERIFRQHQIGRDPRDPSR